MNSEAAKYPQDILIPPKGNGALPPITRYNAQNVRREYFTYVTSFDALARGDTASNIIALRPDGDFWLTSINAQMCRTTGEPVNADLLCQITDIRTGYNFYRPHVSVRAIGTPTNQLIAARAQDIIEPYCFLRGGSIRVTVWAPNRFAAFTIGSTYFVLNGWLEYQNAAY